MKSIQILLLCVAFTTTFNALSQADTSWLKDRKHWIIYNDSKEVMEPSDETGGVQAIWVKDEHNFWVATGGLVHEVRNNKWLAHDSGNHPENDSVGFNVTDIYKCPFNDNIWFSSRVYGVTRFNGKKWERCSSIYPEIPEFIVVNYVREDREGNILIMGSMQGSTMTILFNPKTKEVKNCTELASIQAYCHPTLDEKGYLTIVGKNEMHKYINNEWKKIPFPKGFDIGTNPVKEIAIDKQGTTWILTQSYSINDVRLIKIENDNATVYKGEQLPQKLNYVNGLFLDSKGRVWLSSKYSGYFRFDGKTWLNITPKNSLLEGHTCEALFLCNDNLWFGTDQGLYIFKPSIK